MVFVPSGHLGIPRQRLKAGKGGGGRPYGMRAVFVYYNHLKKQHALRRLRYADSTGHLRQIIGELPLTEGFCFLSPLWFF